MLATAQNKKDDRAFANHYNRAVAKKHEAAFELNRTYINERELLIGSRLTNPDGTKMTYKQSQAAEMASWKAAWRFNRISRDDTAAKKMMAD